MAKKFQLQIHKPCHEDWDKMTPTDKGRFCNSCQKAVVDFTGMSDARLIAFFKKPSTGSVCGRLFSDQLNRNYEVPGKRLPWLKYLFQIVIPAFLISSKARSQGEAIAIKGDTILFEPKKTGEEKVCLPMAKKIDSSQIKGCVVDSKGNPIPLASIIVKGTQNGVMANYNGEFKIHPFANWQQIILSVSSVGFRNKEIIINRSEAKELLVILEEEQLRGIDVGFIIVKRKPSLPLFQRIFKDTVFKFFKIYPNPVASGSSIKIGLKKSEPGEYNIDLMNQGGQMVYSGILNFTSKKEATSFNVPSIIAGSYILQLTNKKTGKKHAEKIIIQ